MEPALAAASASASPDPSPHEHSPAKRSAWKHPSSNGFVDARPSGVIDANHWPALSETAKAKQAPPSDSSKPPPDSSPAPAAAAAASSSATANPSNSLKHTPGTHHGRQKPARRGGGGGDHSPRDHPERGTGGWDHGSGGRGGQRSHHNGGGRRGGGNSGSGGGVAHHGGAFGGGRRSGGFEGFYRGPPMGIGPYMRGAPPPPPPLAVAPPFMGPPPPPVSPMRAFAGPMMFHEMPSPVSPVSPMYYVGPPPPPEALRGLAFAPPMVGPPAYPYFHPPAEPEPEPDADADADPEDDRGKLLKQIEFYFSKDNLCTDVFLRRNMDEQGWVDISLIAGFNKVQELTDNLQYIKETIQSSSILEMQGNKIRRQNDWNKWVIPRECNPDILSSSAAAPSSDVNNLTARLAGVGLHELASSSSTVDRNHREVLNGSTASNNQAPVVEDNAGHH